MKSDLEQRLREALHDDAARARLVNPERPADPDARSLPSAQQPARSPWRLAAAAAAIALIVAAGAVVLDNARDRETEVTTSSRILAKGEDVKIAGFSGLDGATLHIDAVDDGEVAGELRIDNLVVIIQCAATRTEPRDLVLGGKVTGNADGLATLDDVNVAVGDLLALIIRERSDGQRITLYHPSLWYGEQASEHAGSCSNLVESVPANMDGGFFDDVANGHVIETG
jgi:hypothetical protein